MAWHYLRGDEQVGPVSESEFQALVDARIISTETLVWTEGMADWQAYGALQQPVAPPAPGPPQQAGVLESHACAECGNYFSSEEMVHYGDSWICAQCKPVFFQRLREGAAVPVAMEYAGFWIRFLAKFIDSMIIGVMNAVIRAAMGPLFGPSEAPDFPAVFFASLPLMIVGYAVGVTYTTWFIGKFAATPGKMACGLKIVTEDGGRVTYLRAFARYFAEMLSALVLFIGYIMAAFDSEKRALHDHICSTRVIRK